MGNAHLQSPSNPKVFAVGPCNNLGEPAMVMKYEAQCLLVAKNVKAFLKGAALGAHKEAEPKTKASVVQKIGHNTYAFTSTNAPFYPAVKSAKHCRVWAVIFTGTPQPDAFGRASRNR